MLCTSNKTTYVLREYFGERIAFYFAFMLHLWDFSLIIGVIMIPLIFLWNSCQDAPRGLYSDECAWVGAGTTFVILVWSVYVTEYWKRKEWRLVIKWGMSRVSQRNIVWDLHEGLSVISPIDGYLEKIHYNECAWKLTFIPIVLIVVLFITLMCGLYIYVDFLYRRHSSGGAVLMGYLFMVLNELIIAIYEELDIALTEVENHRYFEDLEISIIIKRILFYFVNSMTVLVYFAYIKVTMFPCEYARKGVDPKNNYMSEAELEAHIDQLVKDFGVDKCEELPSKSKPPFWSVLIPGDINWDASKCCFALDHERLDDYEGLTYMEYANKAAAFQTFEFAKGWLVARLVVQNIMEWFFPRFFGFLCARGLYPCVICDFFYDLCCVQCAESTQHTEDVADSAVMQRKLERDAQGCMGLCCETKITLDAQRMKEFPNKQIPVSLIHSCEMQCDRQTYFKVIDNTNELAVQFMYCNVFAMAFPMSPLLFLANSVIEFNADLYRLFDRRRPIPTAADGLAAIWSIIFDAIIYVSVISNMLWCAYHTNIAQIISGSGTPFARLMFFTLGVGVIMLVLMLLQICIQDQPEDVQDHLARQRKVELRMVSQACTKQHADMSAKMSDKMEEIKSAVAARRGKGGIMVDA